MKKRILITIFILIAILAITIPASAAWSDKVTGGGQAFAGVPFSITVSAWDDGSGGVAGQMEYSRSDLTFHGTVECVGIFSEGTVAVAAGPTKVQYDPSGLIGSGDWLVVEIKEGGVGSGDRVRVRLKTAAEGQAICLKPSYSFPGLIIDGNFNIRSK